MPSLAELFDTAVGMSWSRCQQLLGEAIVVADPMVTAGQVARVLGLERGQVLRLHRQGWLARADAGSARRCYRLSSVLALLQPITIAAAAELIGCAGHRVATNPDRTLRRLDAVLQRGRRRKPPPPKWPTPATDPVPVDQLLQDFAGQESALSEARAPVGSEPAPVEPLRLTPVVVGELPDRWLDLVEAAQVLQVSHRTAQRMAAAGQLPGVKTLHGWQVPYSKLVLVRNARQAAAERSSSSSPRRPGNQ